MKLTYDPPPARPGPLARLVEAFVENVLARLALLVARIR